MQRLLYIVEQHRQACTRDGDDCIRVEAQGRTAHRDFERGGGIAVA